MGFNATVLLVASLEGSIVLLWTFPESFSSFSMHSDDGSSSKPNRQGKLLAFKLDCQQACLIWLHFWPTQPPAASPPRSLEGIRASSISQSNSLNQLRSQRTEAGRKKNVGKTLCMRRAFVMIFKWVCTVSTPRPKPDQSSASPCQGDIREKRGI